LKSADMGVFQVTAVNSVDVSDYGSYDTSAFEKQITAVVRRSFLYKIIRLAHNKFLTEHPLTKGCFLCYCYTFSQGLRSDGSERGIWENGELIRR